MLNLKNTLDGYLKNVEVIGNTIQDVNNLANIRSVGDKVDGQELYKIELACYGDNILRPDFELGLWNTGNGTAQADSTAIRTKGFLRIRNQAHLVKRFDGKLGCQVILFDENFKYLGQQSYAGGSYVRYDNILPNAKYMKINFLNTTDLNLQCVLFDRVPSNINGVEFVAFQESELEILSPVQLEKVGDVADRIICKDGVWGVEKNVVDLILNGSENWFSSRISTNTILFRFSKSLDTLYLDNVYYINTLFKSVRGADSWNNDTECVAITTDKHIDVRISKSRLNTEDVNGFKDYLKNNPVTIKYPITNPQFIPLPHDQQVKLRTFAGQTNIAFLTEIPGQIKAQVPKSLGATVNTHTEQIADLHNSLDRVKKLEETTVSTVETVSNFTTVDATSNGYFEDVKLEGKTLVNTVSYDASNFLTLNATIEDGNVFKLLWSSDENHSNIRPRIGAHNYKPNTTYTIVVNILENTSGARLGMSKANTCIQNFPLGSNFPNRVGISTLTMEIGDMSETYYTDLYFCSWDKGGDLSKHIKFTYMILEGDHTNNPPSYFEGLMSVGQDVEEVSVASMNENLWSNGRVTIGTDNVIPKNANAYVYLKRGDYFLSCNHANDSDSSTSFRFSVKRNNSTGEVISGLKVIDNMFTVNDDGMYYIAIDRASGFNGKITSGDICLVSSSNFTQYIPHQSNKKPLLYYNPTTETWEKPILREWDTIEKHSDGKYYYHKRSGEVTLNGSESWSVYDIQSHINTFGAKLPFKDVENVIGANCMVDTITKQPSAQVSTLDEEGLYLRGDSKLCYIKVLRSKLSTQDLAGFKAWLKSNPTTVVYKLAQEEVYECTNIDLMTYNGETNYIINSGAISPKSLLKVHNNISNVVKILQEKVSLLENTFIAGLRSVLSGDMYSLATILYPEDFEQNDNTEQDIMVIPE